jgi:hypothetical protein
MFKYEAMWSVLCTIQVGDGKEDIYLKTATCLVGGGHGLLHLSQHPARLASVVGKKRCEPKTPRLTKDPFIAF